MRQPGIEPGSIAWKATMLTFTPPTLDDGVSILIATYIREYWSYFLSIDKDGRDLDIIYVYDAKKNILKQIDLKNKKAKPKPKKQQHQ